MSKKVRAFALRICVLFLGVFVGFGSAAYAVTIPSLPEKIVYVAGGDVWTSNFDGTNATQVTNDGAVYSDPQLSPDKSKIAVVRTEGASRSRIYTMDVNGSNAAILTETYKDYTGLGSVYTYYGSQYSPQWNPAGTRVAFYSVEPIHPGGDPYNLFDAPLGGQGVAYRNGLNPKYSNDGNSLFYLVRDTVGVDIMWKLKSYSFAVNTMTELYRTANVLGEFAVSPNNNKVVVQEISGEDTASLVIVDTSRDFSTQIVISITHPQFTYLEQPTWTNDGSKLAVIGSSAANPSKSVLVYTMATESFDTAQNANPGDQGYNNPLWDETGRYLLVEHTGNPEAPTTLAVIDTETATLVDMNTESEEPVVVDPEPQPEVVVPTTPTPSPTQEPQVLGTTSAEKTQTTSDAAKKTAVLGETTLPATGIMARQQSYAALYLVVIGSMLLLASKLYEKR